MAGWAAGLVKVIPGLGGGRGKADVEAKGLELADVTWIFFSRLKRRACQSGRRSVERVSGSLGGAK